MPVHCRAPRAWRPLPYRSATRRTLTWATPSRTPLSIFASTSSCAPRVFRRASQGPQGRVVPFGGARQGPDRRLRTAVSSADRAESLSRLSRGLPTHSAPPVTAHRRIRIHSLRLQRLFSTKPSRCRARARDVVLHADRLRFLHVSATLGDVPPSHAHRPARDRAHCAHVHKLCSYIRVAKAVLTRASLASRSTQVGVPPACRHGGVQ